VGGPLAERRSFVEAAVVATATAWFVWRAVQLEVWDRPLGNDWESYLRNVWAVGTDRWATYNGWRGPLHAWLTLAALPLCGTPLAASKAVSIVATAVAIPATWALGRAMTIPGAVWAAVLFALWPDLEVVAHFSTMYPLLMALLVGGAALFAASTFPAAAAGVLFGLACATDIRGAALAASFVATAAAVKPTRAALLRVALCTSAAVLVGWLLLSRVPVRLVPLAEQIATQSLLRPMEDVSTENIRSILRAGPHLVGIAFLCAPLGLLGQARARLPLAVPIAVLLTSLAIVPLQFRYFLPVAPFVALLAAAGITTVLRRAPWFVPGVVVLALCWTRRVSDASLLYALRHPAPGSIELDAAGFARVDEGITAVERAQRDERLEQVVDCSTLGITDIVVFPTPLLRPPPDACARIARTGVLGDQSTMLLTDDPSAVSPDVWLERAVVAAPDRSSRAETRLGVYVSARR
jgi:hypothetical protein